ncbi:hypothetical protein K466DRAFT_599922 [Polyporus arcularius HHB13444]|uniref:Uncharacterized protein n=1 Tax=Polyporus arcularius HHB13444 TaxID=1314778 RepID=A0A5C3PCB3_9APHY|nr:hypothetical protein K466DRAFT_599922 [Polyporus arcularius HHB13444]
MTEEESQAPPTLPAFPTPVRHIGEVAPTSQTYERELNWPPAGSGSDCQQSSRTTRAGDRWNCSVWFMKAERWQALSMTEDGKTQYEYREPRGPAQQSFEAMAEALKVRAEPVAPRLSAMLLAAWIVDH